MDDTDDHPEHSSGTSAVVSSNPSVSSSSKPISSWTAEDVVKFLQLFGLTERGVRTSQTPNAVVAVPGRQICAWNNTQRVDFLRAAGLSDSAIILAALALGSCIGSDPRSQGLQQISDPVEAGKSAVSGGTDALTRLSQQFIFPYIDKSNIVENFTTYLSECLTAFQRASDTHFAPYVSLVQSSGYGKSRLLRETAKQIATLYVCFRSNPSSGYSRRSRSDNTGRAGLIWRPG